MGSGADVGIARSERTSMDARYCCSIEMADMAIREGSKETIKTAMNEVKIREDHGRREIRVHITRKMLLHG